MADAIHNSGDPHKLLYPEPWFWRGSVTPPKWIPANCFNRDFVAIGLHPYLAVNLESEIDYRLSQYRANLPILNQYASMSMTETGPMANDTVQERWVQEMLKIRDDFNMGIVLYQYAGENGGIKGVDWYDRFLPVILPFSDSFVEMSKWQQINGTWNTR